nr:hypothetical protein [uncultured Pseudodesulfovibrio sp.]
MDYELALEWLSEFIDEDGYFSFRASGKGEMEISCSNGECSIEVFKTEEDITLEGAAETAEELYEVLGSAVSELLDDEDDAVNDVVDTLVSHMYGSVADDD